MGRDILIVPEKKETYLWGVSVGGGVEGEWAGEEGWEVGGKVIGWNKWGRGYRVKANGAKMENGRWESEGWETYCTNGALCNPPSKWGGSTT